ncbi:MAG: hypothetical protein ACQERJ_05065, partial [Bacillota bacterium]
NRLKGGDTIMYQDDYLFFPEAKTMDKLLSVFNIQSQQQLQPEKVINILSLLNLLNITSNNNPTDSLNLNNNQTINNLVENLQSQNNNNPLENLINSVEGNNSSNTSPLTNLLSMVNGGQNNNQNNTLDPTLVLKLMNLIKQFKTTTPTKEEETERKSTNEPVKSEPNSNAQQEE